MDGQELSFWGFVVQDGHGWKCQFCAHKFAEGTSISRIKWHLAGFYGKGTKICEQVPDHVRDTARQANPRENKRRKTMPSSSNNELNNAVSTSIREQGTGTENQETDVEIMQIQVQGIEGEQWQGMVSSHTETGNHIESIIGKPMQPAEKVRPPGRPVLDAQEISGDALLTTELVGKAFKGYMDQIWSWLMEEDVLSIGIYGMGGVGKTALAKHIHNRLLKDHGLSGRVYWVTVTPDFSIQKLQNSIASCVHLDLSNEDDENKRAAKLWKVLIRNNKSVLILDDVRNYIPLNKVGIPICKNGCKLVLTTRSLDFCRMIRCQKNFKVEPLLFEEGWDLFMEELGQETAFSSEIEKIAKSMVSECAGLPLEIVCMARSMGGMVDICEWRNALEEMSGSIPRLYNKEVFQQLKLSFDHLDSELQQCFIYCALFPKNYYISRQKLINYLIDEGIIKKMSNRQAEFDKGHSMLNTLENICLLESGTTGEGKGRCVKMLGFMRRMALQMLRTNTPIMVEAGENLDKLPDEEKWTQDLGRISLVENKVREIPSSHSPSCPNLSTLLLFGNRKLELIANSFFNQLHGLKVLDLSDTAIEELPDSISHLASLTALLLSHCWRLKHLPSLRELKLLERLDLTFAGLEEVPQGMESMANLRYLDLFGTSIKELRAGILSNLSHLQILRLGMPLQTSVIREIACLRKLEVLECCFSNIRDIFGYFERRSETLIKYNFRVGPTSGLVKRYGKDFEYLDYDCCTESQVYKKRIGLVNCDIGRGDFQPPTDIHCLDIYSCGTTRSLYSLLQYAAELKVLSITSCDGIECLTPFSPHLFTSLKILRLENLENLGVLIDMEEGGPLILPHTATFSLLKKIQMEGCSIIKKLFPSGLLPNLQNLEEIVVGFCPQLKEIIESEGQEETSGVSRSLATFSLLKKIKISFCSSIKKLFPSCLLPNLQNLEEIIVDHCPLLEEIIESEGQEGTSGVPRSLATFSRLKRIEIEGCLSIKKVFPSGLLSNLQNLEEIVVIDCEELEEIIESEGQEGTSGVSRFLATFSRLKKFVMSGCSSTKKLFPSGLLLNLQNLEEIVVIDSEELEEIIESEGQERTLGVFCSLATFSLLKKIKISFFSRIKKLFPSGLLPNLQNLEEIAVSDCPQLEEIIESEGQEGTSGEFSLPKLWLLKLERLPELKSICSRVMICNSIQQIHAINCPRLGNIPISLPLPSLERIVVRPGEWWDTVVWGDSPDAKNTLQRFCICPSESDDLFILKLMMP